MKLRIFNIIKNTKVEGPGKRYCIWVQGCSKHCKGCQATHTWSHDSGFLYDVKDIVEDILNQQNIEGVTFLGGEPFEQAQSLSIIAKEVKEHGLSILTFTGNLIENLQQSKDENILALINNTDLLIDGEFMINKLDYSRPWVGSTNQRYHFLTDRYNESILEKYKNKIEVNISQNGQIFMNGMGDFDLVEKKLELLKLK